MLVLLGGARPLARSMASVDEALWPSNIAIAMAWCVCVVDLKGGTKEGDDRGDMYAPQVRTTQSATTHVVYSK